MRRFVALVLAVVVLAGCTRTEPAPHPPTSPPPAPVTAHAAYAGALAAIARVDANARLLEAESVNLSPDGRATNWTFAFRAHVAPGDVVPTGDLYEVQTNGTDGAFPHLAPGDVRVYARAPDGVARVSLAWVDPTALAFGGVSLATLRLLPDGCPDTPAGAAWVATARLGQRTLAWNATSGAACRDTSLPPVRLAPATSFSAIGEQELDLTAGGAGLSTSATVASHVNDSVRVTLELRSLPDLAGLPPGIDATFVPSSLLLAGHDSADVRITITATNATRIGHYTFFLASEEGEARYPTAFAEIGATVR